MPRQVISEIDQFITNPEIYTFSFNTNQLPENEVWNDGSFKKLFQALYHKRSHCLYWFSLETKEIGNQVKNFVNSKRDWLKLKERTLPAKNYNFDSNILYVGIRRGGYRKRDNLTNIAGRIIQHLGYYEKGSTQSLQLKYWAKEIGVNISVNVIEYKDLPQPSYLNIIEQLYAIKLRPVLGKH